MKTRKIGFTCIVTLLLALILAGCGDGSDKASEQTSSGSVKSEKIAAPTESEGLPLEDIDSEDIVIMYTTDIHNKIDDYIGYAGLASYKKKVTEVCGTDHLALVDTGDCLDGGPLGEDSSGSAIITIMNYLGYDVAAPGNHEFVYGMDNYLQLTKQADFDCISCNLRDLSTMKQVLKPYSIIEKGGKKLAFIGVSTKDTETMIPDNYYLQGDTQMKKYDVSEDVFYDQVQMTIDEVRNQGVDYVIALTHLGYKGGLLDHTSGAMISKTTGIDVVIDGHAHKEWEMQELTNADGKKVILTSAGYYLMNIGQLVIDKEGNITTKLIRMADYLDKDKETAEFISTLEN